MRIKQVKHGSRVNGLHFPSWEKGWIAYVFVFSGFRKTMKPQEFFQAVLTLSICHPPFLCLSYTIPTSSTPPPKKENQSKNQVLTRSLYFYWPAYFNQNILNSWALLFMSSQHHRKGELISKPMQMHDKWPEKQVSLCQQSGKAEIRHTWITVWSLFFLEEHFLLICNMQFWVVQVTWYFKTRSVLKRLWLLCRSLNSLFLPSCHYRHLGISTNFPL